METIPRAVYTKQLREEAVKLVTEGELSIPEVGRRLSIATSTIRCWVKASREGKLQEDARQHRPLTEVEMELVRVKRELAQVKIEREISKKQPRTLPRSRWQAREHEADAAPILYSPDVPRFRRISERVLQMA